MRLADAGGPLRERLDRRGMPDATAQNLVGALVDIALLEADRRDRPRSGTPPPARQISRSRHGEQSGHGHIHTVGLEVRFEVKRLGCTETADRQYRNETALP
jgi:hypothetical protein